ncbi:hypothetical protein ACFVYA_40875 [Amycolatopsis sp. NPDC058278]|uniref:hypothetical protein n=1 Tax=Amycolatopsis sp. NPDC058278 TaxID=3346417 RepID=UPI0036D8E5E6
MTEALQVGSIELGGALGEEPLDILGAATKRVAGLLNSRHVLGVGHAATGQQFLHPGALQGNGWRLRHPRRAASRRPVDRQ